MNCDEFLDTIDGSENLDSAQQEHVNSCESCKNAFVASAAFVSCRKPLSVADSAKIAVISKMALSASNNSELANTKTSSGISSMFPAVVKLVLVAATIVGATLITSLVSDEKQPVEKQIISQQKPDLSKTLVKKLNIPYVYKTGTHTIDEDNCKITFLSPCSFTFTDKGLKITEGQAKFEMNGSEKPLTVYCDSGSIKISSGTLLCKIENGRMTVNVLSGVVEQNKNSSAKIINTEQSPVTKPGTTERGGVVLMSPSKEEVEKVDGSSK